VLVPQAALLRVPAPDVLGQRAIVGELDAPADGPCPLREGPELGCELVRRHHRVGIRARYDALGTARLEKAGACSIHPHPAGGARSLARTLQEVEFQRWMHAADFVGAFFSFVRTAIEYQGCASLADAPAEILTRIASRSRGLAGRLCFSLPTLDTLIATYFKGADDPCKENAHTLSLPASPALKSGFLSGSACRSSPTLAGSRPQDLTRARSGLTRSTVAAQPSRVAPGPTPSCISTIAPCEILPLMRASISSGAPPVLCVSGPADEPEPVFDCHLFGRRCDEAPRRSPIPYGPPERQES